MKIQVLEQRLRLERIKKYGPASDQLSDAQLKLLDDEPGVSREEVEAESRREALPEPRERRARRPHPGRQALPPELPRVERVIPCTAAQCQCKSCGEAMEVIGYEESEVLDVEPAKYFVAVIQREKRACRRCPQGGVAAAPVLARIVDKGLVSDRMVIDTIVGKYCDHLPLYRQSAIVERETGVEISRATMDGWVMRVGELLGPVARAIGREVLASGYVQADETTVDVQMHDGRGHNHEAYLWQYGWPGGGVMFDFRLGRGRDGPKEFLGNYEGILQTDGYIAYEKVGGPKLVHAACWAHARRGFVDACKLNPRDAAAKGIVDLINKLFAVDAEARRLGVDAAGRDALRQERSRPLLDKIKAAIDAAGNTTLPSSKLGEAIKYTRELWPKLIRFLDHPVLELSNNIAENSMRPIAVGRKNWIHIGSPKAGPKVAAILSVVETCKRLDMPVREYLAAVLPGLAGVSIQKIPELTPAAWAARQG
ncbi:MAG: IS66 family transposase [Acidobacteriota bacterium]